MQNDRVKLLLWMLEDVRKETLEGVSGLNKEQLFRPPIEGEYPIGAYLMHLGEAEAGWLAVLTGVKPSDEIKKMVYYDSWFDPGKESHPPKEAPGVEDYHKAISAVRKQLTDYIGGLKDSDLDEFVTRMRRGEEQKLTRQWIIYHLIEHEAHHRGQMFMLIRKAGWKKN